MTGRVVHFEIPYDDASRADAFYTGVFGWTASSVPGMDYTLVSTGPSGDDGQPAVPGFVHGGLTPRSRAAGSGPLVVVDVDDLDDTLAQVVHAGGDVVQGKAAVGGIGYTAYVRDTEGNVLGLWQSVRRDPS
ncbi:MAG: hypothetical protein JWP95_2125 [Actinotalea sp.]|nr:hypothetical protein [Actinotalea sp.]